MRHISRRRLQYVVAVLLLWACGFSEAARPGASAVEDEAIAGKPLTRDALFSDEKPVSRAELFGEEKATAPPTRWSGFVDLLGAYTYARPVHWSRGVARLQLSGQGELGPAVKWKLSGRVDADPVYLSSDFYPARVKRDQRLDFFYRENYVDFSAADWDFRLGAQNIVWGEVMGLFFADVVSARDMREFLLPSFDIIRIPQWAGRAEYTRDDSHVELVWIPVPVFDRIGKAGADFYPVPLPHSVSDETADLFRDPARPSRSLNNSNYGVRANTLVSGWDLAGFYYRSYSTSPTFYRLATGSAAQPFVFEPRYDRIWQGGATVSKDLGEMVLRAETVYTHGQNFAVTDLTSAQSTVGRSTLDYIASLEWTFANDTRLNIQAFQRHYFGGGAEGIAFSNEGFGGTAFLSTKWRANLEPQILLIRNFKDRGSLIRPRLNWTAARNLTLGFGADIFAGPSDSFFGRFNNRDRLYTEVRYDF